MGSVTDYRARLQARITKIETILDNLYTTYDELSEKTLQKYEFHSSQSEIHADRIRLDQINFEIDSWEKKLESLYNKLNGKSVIRMNVNRYIG